MTEEPPENKRKEAPQELPEVEPASGQDRIHTIPLSPFQVVPIHPVVEFEVRDDRLDHRPSFQPPSDRRFLFPQPGSVEMHCGGITGDVVFAEPALRLLAIPSHAFGNVLKGPQAAERIVDHRQDQLKGNGEPNVGIGETPHPDFLKPGSP